MTSWMMFAALFVVSSILLCLIILTLALLALTKVLEMIKKREAEKA